MKNRFLAFAICLLCAIVGMSTSTTRADSLRAMIFLSPNVDGRPYQTLEQIDSLKEAYSESADSADLFFVEISYALKFVHSDVQNSVSHMSNASKYIPVGRMEELLPYLYLLQGTVYLELNRLSDSGEYFSKATSLFQDTNQLMYIQSKLMTAYLVLQSENPVEHQKTISELHQLLENSTIKSDWLYQQLKLKFYNIRSLSKILIGEFEQAEESLLETKRLSEELTDEAMLRNTLGNLAYVYMSTDRHALAVKSAMHDLEYSLRVSDHASVNSLAGVLTRCHLKLGQLDSAAKYADMMTKYDSYFLGWVTLKNNFETVMDYYKEVGRSDLIVSAQQHYLVLMDSIYNFRSSQYYKLVDSEIELRRASDEIADLNTLNDLKTIAIISQRRTSQWLAVSVFVSVILLVVAYRHIHYTRKQNHLLKDQQQEIENQKREISIQRDQLENQNRNLVQLNEDKNELMGIVSHDLRSPLNQIKGFVQLMKTQNGMLSQDYEKYINIIFDSANRLDLMISRVLNINAIESSKIDLKLEKINCQEILDLMSANFEILSDKKNIRILKEFDLEPSYINADKSYMIRVLENLVSNAIKFSHPNSKIYLSNERTENENRIIVRDEGPGISSHDKEKLFNKYQKLTAKPTGGEESSGLGLSIVKKYLEIMGGSIRCESELGKGASFIITMPDVNAG